MFKAPYTTHPVRLHIYSHDITSPPWIFKKLIKEADVVVQPRSEEDLVEILEYAKENKMPIVPRGAATSGYGGAVPYKGGIIVDFSKMNKFEVDEDEGILISQPGAVWLDVKKEVEKKGFSLKVYPTSAPSSTVGGWISQGGYGIGSFKYGAIWENVEKIRVLDFRGFRETSNLLFYSGLCGTTGLITKAWVKLKDYVEHRKYAHNTDAGIIMKTVKARPPKLTTILLYGHKTMELKKEIEDPSLPEFSAAIFEYEDPNVSENELGEKLWSKVFYPLRIKRKGPSLIVSEVFLSYATAEDYIYWLENEEIPYEVLFAKRGAAVLAMFFEDERKFGYTLAWRKALKVMRVAERKYKAIPYSVGMYLAHKAKKYFENYDELLELKKLVDPYNLLNPGKVFPSALSFIAKIANMVVI